MTGRRQSGFSLIEVVVALSIAAIVVLIARSMLEAIGDNSRNVMRITASNDAEANGRQMLRTLLEMTATQGDSVGFVGKPQWTRFGSRCASPGGWTERCVVTLRVDTARGAAAFRLAINSEMELLLEHGFRFGAILYLAAATDGGVWVRDWVSKQSAPLALGLVADGDTTIVRVGGAE